jgi:hypothetical protein
MVSHEDTVALVVGPVEGRVGVTLAFGVFHGAFQYKTVAVVVVSYEVKDVHRLPFAQVRVVFLQVERQDRRLSTSPTSQTFFG